jgi:hypothetical protein
MIIGRGRRREHPKDTSKGVTWPSVTTNVAQLPVPHAHTQGIPEGVKWPKVTFGSHVTTTKKKARGKSRECAEPTSGHVTVTSGQKAPFGRIWHNFRLRMRRTYFQTMTNVTSCHVTRHFLSRHFRSCAVVPFPANTNWAVPIYYFYHIMLYRAHLACAGFELATLVVMGTDCIGSCKSNYHTITTMMTPYSIVSSTACHERDVNSQC